MFNTTSGCDNIPLKSEYLCIGGGDFENSSIESNPNVVNDKIKLGFQCSEEFKVSTDRDNCVYNLAQETENKSICNNFVNKVVITNLKYGVISFNFSQQIYYSNETNRTPECLKNIDMKEYIQNNSLKDSNISSHGYKELYNNIIKCNSAFIFGSESDFCFGYYRITNYHECSYASDIKVCPNFEGTLLTEVERYNVSFSEAKELCNEFVHKGLIADCLRQIAIEFPNESNKNECSDFALNDTYLKAICNLTKNGVLIDSFSARNISDFN